MNGFPCFFRSNRISGWCTTCEGVDDEPVNPGLSCCFTLSHSCVAEFDGMLVSQFEENARSEIDDGEDESVENIYRIGLGEVVEFHIEYSCPADESVFVHIR